MTMRNITAHKVNPANDKLHIEVVDQPGAGGANHRYVITGFDAETNKSYDRLRDKRTSSVVLFQNGAINEVGVNGVTHEALLAIVQDRLESFQQGPFACEENAEALKHIAEAQAFLQARTKSRIDAGVEGTHEKRPGEGEASKRASKRKVAPAKIDAAADEGTNAA